MIHDRISLKSVGGLGTGCNVFMLQIWRDHGGAGPWMHSMHFAFGIGSTLGPMVATPFLRQGQLDTEHFGITTLYPIVGSIACLCGLSFLFIGIYDAIAFAKGSKGSLHSSLPGLQAI